MQSLPIRQFLLTNLTRASDGPNSYQKFRIPLRTLASALDNMADFPIKDPEEARCNGPSLFVRGTKSHYMADETLPVIGSFFPRFEIRDIEAGHWVISENPMGFRDGMLDLSESCSCMAPLMSSRQPLLSFSGTSPNQPQIGECGGNFQRDPESVRAISNSTNSHRHLSDPVPPLRNL